MKNCLKSLISIQVIITCIVIAMVSSLLSCSEASKEKTDSSESKYLKISEQGTFAIGETVKESPGTFDPIAHGAFNPTDQSMEGQTLHGNVTLVVLPEKGVDGNTHFLMSDLNNQEIANLMYEWLAKMN